MSGFGRTTTFVFITSDIGKEKEVLDRIRGYDGVRDACLLYGVYSGVVEIDGSNYQELIHRIRETQHVYTATISPVVDLSKKS